MTKEQNQIAIRELEVLKEFLESKETQFQNPQNEYEQGKLSVCLIFLDEVSDRLKIIRQEQKFDEILDSASAGNVSEIDKLRKENEELQERLEEALTGGSARRPRKKSDEEYTAHIQQELADAEVIQTSEEKAETTPSKVPEENKYINWNINKRAWIKRNDENIKRFIELQKNNDVGAEYDDLLFKTMITKLDNELEVIRSEIGTGDAIYKLSIIEELFRDHHIDSLKDLDRLLNFAKITSKKEVNFLTEVIGEGKLGGIEFNVYLGAVLKNPIIETKDFSAEIKWESIIQIAEVSGLFDKQLEKVRQDKLINKEGNENA